MARHHILIVLAGFMLNFISGGLTFSYGIFQAEYEKMARQDNTVFSGVSPAEISLIGTLSASLMKLGAPFAVAWCKCFEPRLVVFVGGLIFGVAHIFASFCTASWQFQLSQGLLLGIGSCLAYMPSMTVPPTWFTKRRGLAMGVITSGTGIGGLAFAPALEASISSMGFRDTLRLIGCISLVVICASSYVIQWEPAMAAQLVQQTQGQTLRKRLLQFPLPTWKTAKQPRFIAQFLSSGFQNAAYYAPIYYISSYAQTLGYSDAQGAHFTSLSNACNAIGKAAGGFMADYIGRLNAFFIVTLISCLGTACLWIPSTLVGGSAAQGCFIAFTVVYGLFASAYSGLFSPALVELFGVEQIPRVTGIMYMVQGIAGLVGTPIAGLLIRSQGGTTPRSYLDMAILLSSLTATSTVAVAWVRIDVMHDPSSGTFNWKWHR